jgi:hypothetical protein
VSRRRSGVQVVADGADWLPEMAVSSSSGFKMVQDARYLESDQVRYLVVIV